MKYIAVQKFALSLPDTNEQPHHQMSSFRVRGKIFATVTPELTHLHVFVDAPDRELAQASYPDFTETLFWGGKEVGVRIVIQEAPAAVVRYFLQKSYDKKAGL